MATTRLRKTFRYPYESDDEELPEGIDEEEQEKLISTLRSKDEQTTTLYTNIILALPILLSLTYLPHLFSTPALSLAAITSLLSSAYALKYLPAPALASFDFRSYAGASTSRSPLSGADDAKSPLEMYLDALNAAIVCVLLLGAWSSASRAKTTPGRVWWGLWCVPALVYVLLFLARRTLHSVDVAELERLKYRNKGA